MHFEPIVKLATVEVKTMEENEDELFRMYAHTHTHNQPLHCKQTCTEGALIDISHMHACLQDCLSNLVFWCNYEYLSN